MHIEKAIDLFKDYPKLNHKESTIRSYAPLIRGLLNLFGGQQVELITPDDIFQFLELITSNLSQASKRLRCSQLKSFFNFLIIKLRLNFSNPCQNGLLGRTLRSHCTRKILDKDVIDEIIYRTENLRDRLLLEIQARSGLRIGEILKLTVKDIEGRKIKLLNPKSGNDLELAFLPEHVADRLQHYILGNQVGPEERIFKISYSRARKIIRNLGNRAGVNLRPHDLRRYSESRTITR